MLFDNRAMFRTRLRFYMFVGSMNALRHITLHVLKEFVFIESDLINKQLGDPILSAHTPRSPESNHKKNTIP